jgi:hypothetical protein
MAVWIVKKADVIVFIAQLFMLKLNIAEHLLLCFSIHICIITA